jgi:hypothetical protein
MDVIESKSVERDMQSSLRNLHELERRKTGTPLFRIPL